MQPTDKDYDYSLKFLLVGDSDVGKEEILGGLEDSTPQSPYTTRRGMDHKSTILNIDGKRVRLQLWNTSGKAYCLIAASSVLLGIHISVNCHSGKQLSS